MKGLIKATIDIYKGTADIKDVDLSRLLWTESKRGFLSITEGEKTGPRREYTELPSDVRRSVDALLNNMLRPIGDIYNLSLMTENFRDGTSKRMSAYEMVHKYDQALANLYFAGKNNPEMETLSNNLLGFLSDRSATFAESRMPIIQALKKLKSSSEKYFDPIPHDSDVAEIVYGKSATPKRITEVISGIMADQKRIVQITALNYKLQQIENTIFDLKFRRKMETTEGRYWDSQYKRYKDIINEFNSQINDPQIIFDQNPAAVRNSKGSGKVAVPHLAVFRMNMKTQKVKRYDSYYGQDYIWGKGDVVIENPKTLQLGDNITTKVRNAMHDAFARVDRSLDMNDYQIIKYQFDRYKDSIRKLDIIDPDKPHLDKTRKGLQYEAELSTLADHLELVGGMSLLKSKDYQKQFLRMLLTPRPNSSTFDMTGWDYKKRKNSLSVHFDSNVRNERIVFKFLQRSMDRKAETVIDKDTATEWYKDINDRFKIAYMRQHDATKPLEGELRFDKIDRSPSDFGLLPPLKTLPRFVLDANLNDRARDVLQSYLNGTYFMDPIEVLRMTIGLDQGALAQLPTVENLNQRVKFLWEGTDNIQLGGRDGNWYAPRHTFRNETYHSREKFKGDNIMDGFRKLNRYCFGGG